MARKLRLQKAEATYHILNRGNYRRDLFATVGAAKAFEETLGETCTHFGWVLHAYVVMPDHYHLAVTTPRPNLVEGMHWLQSTFATRFNRFRAESGHLFQGRYKALLVENATALARLAHFIHLNPVRTGLIKADQVAAFRWSSLGHFVRGRGPAGLSAQPWLEQAGWSKGGIDDWPAYREYLIKLARDPQEQAMLQFGAMSDGWAIGSKIWRNRVAQEHAHLAFSSDLPRGEVQEIREKLWLDILAAELTRQEKTFDHIVHDRKSAPWKLAAAEHLRRLTGAPYRWIARELNMGRPASLRVLLCRERARVAQPGAVAARVLLDPQGS